MSEGALPLLLRAIRVRASRAIHESFPRQYEATDGQKMVLRDLLSLRNEATGCPYIPSDVAVVISRGMLNRKFSRTMAARLISLIRRYVEEVDKLSSAEERSLNVEVRLRHRGRVS